MRCCVCESVFFFSMKFVHTYAVFFTLLKLIIPFSKENPSLHQTQQPKLCIKYVVGQLVSIRISLLYTFCITFFSPLLFLMKSTIQSLANTFYNRKSYFSRIIDKGSSIFCLFTFSRMHERKMCCNTCSIFAWMELRYQLAKENTNAILALLHFLVAYLSFPSQNEWLMFACCVLQLQHI